MLTSVHRSKRAMRCSRAVGSSKTPLLSWLIRWQGLPRPMIQTQGTTRTQSCRHQPRSKVPSRSKCSHGASRYPDVLFGYVGGRAATSGATKGTQRPTCRAHRGQDANDEGNGAEDGAAASSADAGGWDSALDARGAMPKCLSQIMHNIAGGANKHRRLISAIAERSLYGRRSKG